MLNLQRNWRDARVAEEARLESVWSSKTAREFESRSLRNKTTEAFRFVRFVIGSPAGA